MDRPPIQAKVIAEDEFDSERRSWRMTLFHEDGTPYASSGTPGADGTDGAPGVDGADGAPGADGAEGPIGPEGPSRARETEVYSSSYGIDGETDNDAELGRTFMILGIETSHAARVRLYATTDQQYADQARPIGIDPEGDHGLIFEFVSDGAETRVLSPVVAGANMETVPIDYCGMWIQNLEGGVVDLDVTLTYLTLEA